MAITKATRLSKIARELNVGISTIVDFLKSKGETIDSNPNTKVSPEQYQLLLEEYSSDISIKKESEKVNLKHLREKRETVSINDIDEEEPLKSNEQEEVVVKDHSLSSDIYETDTEKELSSKVKVNVVGKIDLETKKEESVSPEPEEKPIDVPKEEEKPMVIEEKPQIEEKPLEEVKEKREEEPVRIDKEDDVAPKPAEAREEEVEITEPEPVPEPAPKPESESESESKPEPEPEVQPEANKGKANSEVAEEDDKRVKVVGKIDLDSMNQKTRPARKSKAEREKERKERGEKGKPQKKEEPFSRQQPRRDRPERDRSERKEHKTQEREKPREQKVAPTNNEGNKPQGQDQIIRARAEKLNGPTVLGKIELPQTPKKPTEAEKAADKKKKRKRIRKDKEKVRLEGEQRSGGAGGGQNSNKQHSDKDKFHHGKKGQKPGSHGGRKKVIKKQEISEEDIQKQIKDTLARLTSKGKSKGAKHRREKRDAVSQRQHEEEMLQEQQKSVLKVTEFVSVNELASMMDVQVNEVISTCMSLGLFVSINQRLDAETMTLLAEEFGFSVEFISADVQESIAEEEDKQEDLVPRPPIVTVMGHVDHGKTKLLDYVRSANVVAGEAGGITQHIGAYGVALEDGRQITFLDTPGHEAFTAMRARGAQLTDVAIIMVAADDGIKPQTVEAINHAQAAGVPMVFAINKIDKPTANPEKVKEELANMNILVEDWGGKYQSQEISAKEGLNVTELLEKVLLEAELLELTANANKKALGTVVESELDKGRGYVSTVLVQAGTLKIGDIVLAGTHHGKVKAMYNERGKSVQEAGPSTPVLILGLDGAPQAGDKFNVMDSDREAREISNKREQLQREQEVRTQKHITLDEIGRRIAIGNFQELNVIVKGDVDGSVEALSDSLLKLSTEEIQVNIKHKAVGQISEADILLAAASNAIVIGFQVRPSLSARRLAEKEEIDIRLYSIIYDAIDEVKAAMEGMLSPDIKEEIVSTLEIQETFRISKVGTIAGCIVREGKIKRESKIRIIRDGIVIYTGKLGSLKRFKDDAKEVVSGQECGLNIEGFNDIKVGDMVEAYVEHEVKKKL